DGHSGVNKRLGVDLAVERRGRQLSEGVDAHIGRRQLRFLGVEPGAGNVIMKREHVDGRNRTRFQFLDGKCQSSQWSPIRSVISTSTPRIGEGSALACIFGLPEQPQIRPNHWISSKANGNGRGRNKTYRTIAKNESPSERREQEMRKAILEIVSF